MRAKIEEKISRCADATSTEQPKRVREFDAKDARVQVVDFVVVVEVTVVVDVVRRCLAEIV